LSYYKQSISLTKHIWCWGCYQPSYFKLNLHMT
jgi:pyruvate/2-oxoacid:ferredoxin oxidoreductase beta subunit